MLTEPRDTPERYMRTRVFEAAATIYAGALVALNANKKAIPAADTSGLKVVGRAECSATSGGKVKVLAGCFKLGNGSGDAALTMPGEVAYVTDDETVAKTGSNAVVAGLVCEVESDGVWVDVAAAPLLENSAAQVAAHAAKTAAAGHASA